MDVFKNFKRVFQINWNNILNEISPRGNKLILDKDTITKMVEGIEIIGVSSVLVILLSWIINCNLYFLPIVILKLVICGLLLIYISQKKSDKDPNVLFVGFIISSIAMVLSFLSIILFLPNLLNNMSGFILSLLFCLVDTLGFASIVVGLYDYLKLARKIYDDEHKVETSSEIKLSTIGINDISMHGEVKCSFCQNSISVNDIFCPICGKKLK